MQSPSPCRAPRPSLRLVRQAVLGAFIAAGAGVFTPALSLAAAQAAAVHYDIPAGPLATALNQFGQQAGVLVSYTPEQAAGLQSPGLHGQYDRASALRRLLAGTDLQAVGRVDGGFTLRRRPGPVAATLEPISVVGRRETAYGPVRGYVAQRSATVNKTDTSLMETMQSVSVLTQDEIQARGADRLESALRYMPSVTAEVYGVDNRGYGIQMRGFTEAASVFYMNGLQARGSDFGMFNALEPYGAERLEVMRGPTSVLYGQNSPGGLINYVSKRPTDAAFGEIGTFGGDYGSIGAKFDLGGPLGDDGQVFYRLTGLSRTGDTQTDNVGEDRYFIAPSLTWRPSAATSITLLTHFQRDRGGWAMQYLPASGTVLPNANGEIPRRRFAGDPAYDSYVTNQSSVGYEFEHRASDVWTFRQNARYAYMTHTEDGIFGAGLRDDGRLFDRYAAGGGSRLNAYTLDNQAQARFQTGALKHTVLAGLDYQNYRYNDYSTYADVEPIDLFRPVYGVPLPDIPEVDDVHVRYYQLGAYLQDQLAWGKWRASLAGRKDWTRTSTHERYTGDETRQDDHAFTWRAGLLYLADSGVAPYISYSESFLPALGTETGGRQFVPETGKQYEIGVRYQPPGSRSMVALSLFNLTRRNVVRYFGNDQFQTGEIRSRGVELEAVASLNAGLDLRAAYTYLDMHIRDDSEGNGGNVPFGAPTHTGSLWLDYRLPAAVAEGVGFGAGVRYVGATQGDDANTFKVPAVWLADAGVHYEKNGVRMALNISNVFDRRFVASCFAASLCRLVLRRKLRLLLWRRPQGSGLAYVSLVGPDKQPVRAGGWLFRAPWPAPPRTAGMAAPCPFTWKKLARLLLDFLPAALDILARSMHGVRAAGGEGGKRQDNRQPNSCFHKFSP